MKPALLKKKLALEIVAQLRKQGFQGYFVGGCVRDMLMRKAPKDFDIATDALPAQIKKVFSKESYPIGERFGTILVVKKNMHFQVSTFRNQSGRYSRHLEDDLKARELTINALAYDPANKKIIDLVNGRHDLRKKLVRSFADREAKFRQDPLRLIRAIRFAVSLGFSIDQQTLKLIAKLAKQISRVSKERIRDELILIFTSENPSLGLELLDQTNLLKYILTAVAELKGVRQPEAFHPEGDVFVHTLLMLKSLKNPSLVLAFACLLHDLGKPLTFKIADRIRFSGHDVVGAQLAEEILRELKFTNKDCQEIICCIENHMRITAAPKMRQAKLKRLLARPTFQDELKLHYLDCLASHQDLTIYRFLDKKYKELKKAPRIPAPLLNGHELIRIGFTPGPIFGKIHKQMVDLQLEGKLDTKAKAKKWVERKFKNEKIKSSK
ncbi:CCA tRNA nucleotidyltransferase [Candidatus Omnitrophota bacterium]